MLWKQSVAVVFALLLVTCNLAEAKRASSKTKSRPPSYSRPSSSGTANHEHTKLSYGSNYGSRPKPSVNPATIGRQNIPGGLKGTSSSSRTANHENTKLSYGSNYDSHPNPFVNPATIGWNDPSNNKFQGTGAHEHNKYNSHPKPAVNPATIGWNGPSNNKFQGTGAHEHNKYNSHPKTAVNPATIGWNGPSNNKFQGTGAHEHNKYNSHPKTAVNPATIGRNNPSNNKFQGTMHRPRENSPGGFREIQPIHVKNQYSSYQTQQLPSGAPKSSGPGFGTLVDIGKSLLGPTVREVVKTLTKTPADPVAEPALNAKDRIIIINGQPYTLTESKDGTTIINTNPAAPAQQRATPMLAGKPQPAAAPGPYIGMAPSAPIVPASGSDIGMAPMAPVPNMNGTAFLAPVAATLTESKHYPPAGASYYPAGAMPAGAGYLPGGGGGGGYAAPAGASYLPAGGAYPAGATYYNSPSALPAGATFYPQKSSGPGLGTGLITGAIGGAVLGDVLTPTHTQTVQQAAPVAASHDDKDRIIIINNGQPASVTESKDGTTIINTNPAALAQPGYSAPQPASPIPAGQPAAAPGSNIGMAPLAPMAPAPGSDIGMAPLAPMAPVPNINGTEGAAPLAPFAAGTPNTQAAPQEQGPPPGGIICVPVIVNVTSPTDPANVTQVEQVACYPAPPPAGTPNTQAAPQEQGPPPGGIICVPVLVNVTSLTDPANVTQVEQVACYPAPPPEPQPIANGTVPQTEGMQNQSPPPNMNLEQDKVSTASLP